MTNRLPREARTASSPVDLDVLLDETRTLLARGRAADAFARCQAAYALAPAHPQVNHLLGMIYVGMRQPDMGMAYLRRAIAADPQAADVRRNLATALAAARRWPEVVTEFEAYCALRPDDAEALAGLAQAQMFLDRDEDAANALERALALSPHQADWHAALARLDYRRWRLPAAVEGGRRAVALNPRLAEGLNLGGVEPGNAAPRPAPVDLLEAMPMMGAAELAQACREREVVVIDDALEDPLAYRAEALALCAAQARRAVATSFPGVQTPPRSVDGLMRRVADALGRPLKWDSTDHGAFRVSLAGDEARADVHVDSPTVREIFGGVLYLSLPQDCRGGTSFYRHRRSGWDRRPDDATLRRGGDASFLDFQRRHLPPNRAQDFARWRAERDEAWERLFEIPMRFNRLIVFRSDFFHAITDLFGDRAENGRLVQLLHFEAAPVAEGGCRAG